MKLYTSFLLLLLLSSLSLASEGAVVLVAEKDSATLNNLYKRLQQIAPSYQYSISTASSQVEIKTNDYVIFIGAKIPKFITDKHYEKSISVLVSENQSSRIASQTSIWVEPSLSRQLKLANLVIPGNKKIGLLVHGVEEKQKQLSKLTVSEQAQLKVVDVEESGSINKALFNVLKGTRLLLGSFDNRIYNAKNIKNILITSYRQQKVLIGPSRAYLKAGSFATTFSDLNHVAKRIVDVVKHHESSGKWIAPGYNPYYRILFNQQVARSLNIRVMGDELLKQKLQESEL